MAAAGQQYALVEGGLDRGAQVYPRLGEAGALGQVGDGVDAVNLFADGTTQLPTPLASGTSYTLTLTQPTMPWKTCSVTTGYFAERSR